MSQPKTISVLYFAAASTATGKSEEMVVLPNGDFKLSQLTQLLVSRHPNTNLDSILKTSQWSVDLEMVDDPNSIVLKGGEEVGVICPVSGG
ncbi:hypothetical protein CPB83DRAFT_865348 [Crepidotus variabilis]|uniref:Molybdopterin synthase sulfur carrier subunit n=1 Tax=Crepidotus variabilis TaxID=179855 RepID=A0A9P6E379_9AGAR|nr:hypothetical protein CPB83DRAFT_865348 [Crepidotus variabilis]